MKNRKDLKVEIIAVGSELLTPFFQDTNSLYLSQHLNELGIEVSFKTIVGDAWDDLTLCIQQALSRATLLIAMGGLGPTRDDRTREAFAHVLGRRLIYKEELLQQIKARFKRRGLTMPSINKKQAYIIEGAEILENRNGTAPGLWLEEESKITILLPGPPQELKLMFERFVLPKLQQLRTEYTSYRILKTTGLTESEIESLISPLYPKVSYLDLTTLAYPGQIEIHLRSHSNKSEQEARKNLDKLEKSILHRLKDHVFTTSGEKLEEVVGKLLRAHRKTLAVAESCTGGLLAHRITNIPGSSDYFVRAEVAYSNEVKIHQLDVAPNMIEKNGAVSSKVAQAMAIGIKNKAFSDIGVAITGIAGPSGGTLEKPVGLVYVALAWEEGSAIIKNLFLGQREAIKYQSSQKALDMVRRHLLNIKIK